MVDSDDEFTELCSKLLKRVRKNKPEEPQEIPKPSAVTKNRLKKTKSSVARKQSGNGGRKRADQGIEPGGNVQKASEKPWESSSSTERSNTEPQANVGLPNGNAQQSGDGSETVRSQEMLSVKHLVLERMQQFKRAGPARMKLCSTEDDGTESLPSVAEALQDDGALNTALPMDFRGRQRSLEDEGLFFCQLCQKDLTALNSALREQHVNRCLDHDESVSKVAEPPSVPSCPLCGKSFNTEKSRASHLKRCAAKLDVPAHALLQAVQRQAAETAEPTTHVTQAKRKAGSKQKGPPKKRRAAQPGSEVEDLLVAMALSRSMQEDTAVPSNNSAPRATRPTENAVPVKKAHRKKKDRPAPLLLVQDPQAPLQRLHERMSLLLSEESKLINSIKLPPSRFWDLQETRKAAWSWPRQDEKLWEISNMVENIDPQHYYTRELNPPITPWRPPLKLLNSQPRTAMPTQPALTPPCAIHTGKEQSDETPCREGQHMSSSQKDRQALLDLAELAGEGMTFTQWNLGAGLVTNRTGRESTDEITSSGFVPSQEEEPSTHPPSTAPQVALAADFAQMVNNPHLSDAQLQTDCGEVLNVHMFVLYARCPLLVEAVHSEGFWVDEASTGRVRRLLLNDVSAEAAVSFLRFLYSACTAIPTRCLAHVCELARRFGVNILIDVCDRLVHENHSAEPQAVTDEDDGGARAETFQELLKSMWIDEEEVLAELEDEGLEEGKVDNEGVGEGELEEIYEFAATQRKGIEEQDTENSSSGETESRPRGLESEDSPVEREELTTKADSPLCTAWDSQVSVHTTPLPLTPSTDQVVVVKNVPLRKSPACVTNGNMESSPKLGPLASPVNSSIKSSPGPQASQLPNASFPASSVSRQLFNESTPPRQLTSPGRRRTAFSAVSVNLSKSEDAKKHLCIQHSPLQFDDSYERMFSDTCGEYMEPSGISATGGCSASSPSGEQRRQLKKKAASSTLPPLPQIGTSPDSPLYSLPSLASPPKSQPLSISSVTPPPKSLPCSLPSLPSPTNSQPRSLPSLTSPTNSQPRSLPSSTSPTNSQPRSLPSSTSPTNSQPRSLPSSTSPTNSQPRSLPSLTSPTNSQPRSLPSLTSPANSQPCDLPSPSSPSCSQPLSLSSLASPLKSPLRHLPTLASPTNSRPCSLTSLASPPKSQTRNLPLAGSPTNSQPCSVPSSGPSPISQRCSQPSLESPPKPRPQSWITPNHGPSWQTTSSPCAATQDPEVILILSSDDESEPSVKAADNPKSGEDNERNVSGGIRESPINLGARRSSEGFGHLETSSCTETSWLVPATPLPNAAMSLTSQVQTSRLQPPSESTSVCIPAAPHSVSPAKANSLLSFAQPTPKSSRDPMTSSRSATGQQKTPELHSSFVSNGSRGPSSLPASPANSSVFEVGDSEDEAPLSKTQPETSSHSFYIDYEPPIHMEEELWFNGEETPKRPDSFPEPRSPSPMKTTVIKSPEIGNNDNSVSRSPESVTHGETHRSPDLQSSRQSFLNSQLWDEWEEDERDDLPAVLPLAQRLNKVPDKEKELRTPVSIVRRRELAPKVPITPLPHYSDMDSPILKKELSRFGVRALPKKQMVLKLKEIFRYTHQVMSSDSEDEVPSSQRRRQDHGGTSQAPRYPAGTKGQTSPQAPRRKKLATVCGAKEAAVGEERPMAASQESTSSSAAASDTSSLSQSSAGNEFETAFADEEDDEPIAASQEAGRQAATTEAVRRFIGERPDLYKRILLYQPLELGAVQAELKQSGIKMAAGKLLDFLDAHCVTFTTAAARKEKKSRGRRKGAKRY
ncbi:structure-specific endonuclease subunit SLX4 [Spea bombifrons]|uniref:structure-specific endonuclease subunit SLX4 n=1 Tax=Spea bombifrons TaxID=233779 RepID=UPI00234AD191|nr:structure-specific endonuclease subunit SLX4 [Spea bombifrons]